MDEMTAATLAEQEMLNNMKNDETAGDTGATGGAPGAQAGGTQGAAGGAPLPEDGCESDGGTGVICYKDGKIQEGCVLAPDGYADCPE
jgi:hypothetical protein